MTAKIRGIYESPPLQYTRLVVVSELPVARDTPLMRLLGAGSVLKHAIGNRAQTAGPCDALRTADGWVLVQVVGQPLFARFAALMGARVARRSAVR